MSGLRIRTVAGLIVLAMAALPACGDGDAATDKDGGGADASAGSTVTGTVTVYAAASLTEAFTELGTRFERENPGVAVRFNFAGSSALARQINQGAPADVFASAAPTPMKPVTDAGNAAGEPVTFARNQLVIAVPAGNPKRIAGLTDLARPGVKVAVCAEQVPCGAAATKALATARVTLTPVTLEQDVKAALSKVTLGEVDAALVYRTDARAAAADVAGVEFPESASAINDCPIVVLKNAPNKSGAEAFVALVRSGKGRSVLTGAGFQAP